MAAWPGSLPQRMKLDGNSMKSTFGTQRTAMDSGPEFTRPRYTAVPIAVRGSILLSVAQYNTLETFFHDTLVEGSDTVDWVHPITEAAVTMRFLDAPDYRVISGDTIEAALSLEILP